MLLSGNGSQASVAGEEMKAGWYTDSGLTGYESITDGVIDQADSLITKKTPTPNIYDLLLSLPAYVVPSAEWSIRSG